ncbi:MAG: pilus assembly protein TadG-related protein [Bacillota bacterium]
MKLFREERGAAMVILAAAMAALIGLSALVTDVGLLYLERTRLVQMVDAAALAGIKELPVDQDLAVQTAGDYAQLNGGQVGEYLATAQGTDKLNVSATRQVRLFFAQLFGDKLGRVGAKATAQISPLAGFKGVAPLGIENQTLQYGTLYSLKVGAPPSMGAGGFGALALGKPGASRYEDYLKYNFDNYVRVGDIIETETGNISGPTLRAISYRLSLDQRVPPNTIDDYDKDSPEIIIIPVYEPYEVQSNQIKRIKVLGFAAFFLSGYSGNGTDNYVSGYFIRMVAEGELGPTQADYGLLGVRLIQ